MASKIPLTEAGLTDTVATEAGRLLREGWDVLRSLQFNKKASILRYTEVGGSPQIGVPPERTLVAGLSSLDCYVSRISTREVLAGNGRLELGDLLFIFYQEVKETDEISYQGKTYKIVELRYYDPDIVRSQVVARLI